MTSSQRRSLVPLGWRWLRGAGAVVLAVAAVEYGVVPFIVHARTELSVLDSVRWPLLVMATGLEVVSLAAYTKLTQVLLQADALPFGVQWRIDVVGFGLSHALPGGGATAGGLRAGMMIDRGVAAPAALALTLVQVVMSGLGLLSVWLLGTLMSLPRTGMTATTMVLLVAAVAAVAALETAPRLQRPEGPSPAGRLLGPLRRLVPRRWWEIVASAIRRGLRSLRDTRITRAGVTWASLNWLLDAICLWVCVRAFGGSVPIELVLASYGLVNAVALLQLTPGGIGIVEGLMVPALAATGASAGVALYAVLTWRLLQYWFPMPAALVCWTSLTMTNSGSGHGERARGRREVSRPRP